MRLVLDKLIKCRYLLALIFVIIGVSCQIHGSSLANWNNFGVSEVSKGKKQEVLNQFSQSHSDSVDIPNELRHWIAFPPRDNGTLVGFPRMIRTDEWMVQTPFFISQANTGNHFVNNSYGMTGQNMVIAYNAPVKDLSVIGKPFNWGFLFLGSAYGLSWYWCFKVITMLLLAFEFSMIITKKNTLISLLGSLWITFTPTVQWWFMQHLGDVVFFTLSIIVLVFHYFRSKSIIPKLGFATLLSMSIIGFALVIYPAFQVPFAYLILFFFLLEMIESVKGKKFNKTDILLITATLVFSATVIGLTLIKSQDAIALTLNTVYPGHRISVGGDLSWRRLSDLYSNFILPFKVPKLGNQVEASTSLHLLPYILFILPFIVKKTKIKENIFGFTMLAYSILLFFYTVIGLPEIIARISLFSFVTSGRAWQSLAVIGVFVSIWFIGYVWDSQIISEKRPLVFLSLIITLFLAFITINQAEYRNYIGNKYILMISLAIFILIIAILYKKKVILILTLLPLIVGSGMTVNPVVKGLSAVESKSLTFKIKEIVHRKPQGVWISEGSLYNYPQMFGAKTLNSVRFYPDIKLMRLLDPNNKKQNIWNRYAHMQVFLTKDKTNMQAPVPDVLNIQLSTEELSRLNVNYVLTHRNLQEEFGDSFQRVYGPDLDGNSIYHYKQK